MSLITVLSLKALKVNDHRKRLPDGRGMWGTVRATSNEQNPVSVDFQWRYKFEGKTRDVRIGSWPKTSLAKIREDREKMRAKVKAGVDPITENAAEKLKNKADQLQAVQLQRDRLENLEAEQARINLRTLFELWRNLELRSRADQGMEARRAFERDVFPLLGDKAAADVRKAHIQSILDSIMVRATTKQPMVRTAKRVLSDLRQMFVFAQDRDLVEIDPTAKIKKAKIGPDVERDRVLNESELIDLFEKLPKSGLVETSQCALLIQLATLARIGEVLAARWEDVDIKGAEWLLPKTKNRKPHTVFLSDYALQQFNRLHAQTGVTEWLFPSSGLSGAIDPKTVTKQVSDRQRSGESIVGRTKQIDALKLKGGYWTPHDLRRTGASSMAELGTLPDVIERCLNHTEQNKMKRIYQRAKYEEPMRQAWNLWGAKLEQLQNR